jgi:MacB-like periplasmic core domain
VAIGAAAVMPGLVMGLLGDEIPAGVAGRYVPDWKVIAFTAFVCLLACFTFALAPALQTTRATIPLGALDRSSTRRARLTLRGIFLAAQIAACTALLVGGGLLTRGVMHAMTFDPGYEVGGITRVSVRLPSGTSAAASRQFDAQLLAEIEKIDEPAAVASVSPVTRFPYIVRIALPGEQASDHRPVLRRNGSREYFDVLGIPIISGRMFESTATNELVVNQAFVRSYGIEHPLGMPIREIDSKGAVSRTHTVVGVVRDAYLNGFERIDPMIFLPTTRGTLMTAGGPAAVERIRTAAVALHPQATIHAFPMTDDVRKYLEESRMGATVAWAVGLLGLVLAAVGVFGVFAYAVEERRREIGVRFALGAARRQIVQTLVSSNGKALLAGLAIGFLLSLACGPLLGGYLYGLSPLDPLAYGAVVALLATTALLATLVPARRAMRVDPAVTLRED